jgi:predicted pyridoxine 5'-phosphate oxidase superfamily flavin-nucleotide-binding protein
MDDSPVTTQPFAELADALLPRQPGTTGEHALQERFGTEARARGFYENQMLDHVNAAMQEFVGRMEMCFIGTADAGGACDLSFRAGPPGFVRVLNETTLVYPEYRGNGVMSSLGNLFENPRISLLFIDFFNDKIGLHVNGKAHIQDNGEAGLEVVIEVEEAFVHCSKNIPLLRKLTEDETSAWAADETRARSGDYFRAAAERRARQAA